ncbi:MAG: VWA domain-containing protein [Planctomycetes bacterium]|nr:VWA domain-containing protein [Planctomycetota bacterium]
MRNWRHPTAGILLLICAFRIGSAQDTAGGEPGKGDPKATEPLHVALILDVSLSMDPQWGPNQKAGRNPLGAMQRAALSVLGAFDARDSLAVVSFAGDAKVEFKLTRLESADRIAAGRKLRELRTREATNFEAGLRLGLQELRTAKGRRVALFLSDGTPNRGAHEEVLAEYKKEGIPLYTIGFEGEADWKRLQALAEETNGKFAPADEANLLEILGRFEGQSRGLSEFAASIGTVHRKGETRTVPIKFPDGVNRVRVALTWSGDDEGLELALQTPQGAQVSASTPGVEIDLERAGTLRTIKVQYPEAGTWSAIVTANRVPEAGEMFRISARADLPSPVEWAPFRSSYRPGEVVRLALETAKTPGFTWQVTVRPPGGKELGVDLVDNGVEIDERAGDGLFSAEFSPGKTGIYSVEAVGSPTDGKAPSIHVTGAFVVGSEEEVLR